MIRLAGTLEQSTQVMQAMSNLVKVPQIQATMRELSKEMTKAGIIEEMIDDTFDAVEEDDLEEAAETEVSVRSIRQLVGTRWDHGFCWYNASNVPDRKLLLALLNCAGM